jgi:hypothetical protein
MKNLLMIAATLLLFSCNSGVTETKDDESIPEDRAIGFNTTLPEMKFHLGTERAIQVVKEFDKKWAARDYEAVKGFFADTALCYFPDGTVTHSPEEFVAYISRDDDVADVSWTFDYAFSVDLDPTSGGEHVQAGFTGTSVKDGVETKKVYHESYYIVDGKIVNWTQFDRNILK